MTAHPSPFDALPGTCLGSYYPVWWDLNEQRKCFFLTLHAWARSQCMEPLPAVPTDKALMAFWAAAYPGLQGIVSNESFAATPILRLYTTDCPLQVQVPPPYCTDDCIGSDYCLLGKHYMHCWMDGAQYTVASLGPGR